MSGYPSGRRTLPATLRSDPQREPRPPEPSRALRSAPQQARAVRSRPERSAAGQSAPWRSAAPRSRPEQRRRPRAGGAPSSTDAMSGHPSGRRTLPPTLERESRAPAATCGYLGSKRI
ncbi:hypothetical protein T484DRAFT_1654977 [Baffinella frigidus]|nr:hypothetical protein T484DRAFT_1654977 [Cryptophyta sp. CCMP2293]